MWNERSFELRAGAKDTTASTLKSCPPHLADIDTRRTKIFSPRMDRFYYFCTTGVLPLDRLMREVDIMRRLRHPNIIHLVEALDTPEQVCGLRG